jgi:hypothetical protein
MLRSATLRCRTEGGSCWRTVPAKREWSASTTAHTLTAQWSICRSSACRNVTRHAYSRAFRSDRTWADVVSNGKRHLRRTWRWSSPSPRRESLEQARPGYRHEQLVGGNEKKRAAEGDRPPDPLMQESRREPTDCDCRADQEADNDRHPLASPHTAIIGQGHGAAQPQLHRLRSGPSVTNRHREG